MASDNSSIRRTTSENSDFRALVALLDHDLALRDGKDHAFYAQYNKIDMIRHALVYYADGVPVGCGAFKVFEGDTVEIKRMYVKPEYRNRKIAAILLKELEQWASELHYKACVLETGKANPEALRLYEREGYSIIPNYGQYIGIDNSVCMRKAL